MTRLTKRKWIDLLFSITFMTGVWQSAYHQAPAVAIFCATVLSIWSFFDGCTRCTLSSLDETDRLIEEAKHAIADLRERA